MNEAVCDIPSEYANREGWRSSEERSLDLDGMMHLPGEEMDSIASAPVSARGMRASDGGGGFALSLGRSGKAISHTSSLCGSNTSHLEVPLSTGLKAICKQNWMYLITSLHAASHPAVTDGWAWGKEPEDPSVWPKTALGSSHRSNLELRVRKLGVDMSSALSSSKQFLKSFPRGAGSGSKPHSLLGPWTASASWRKVDPAFCLQGDHWHFLCSSGRVIDDWEKLGFLKFLTEDCPP